MSLMWPMAGACGNIVDLDINMVTGQINALVLSGPPLDFLGLADERTSSFLGPMLSRLEST